MRLPAAGRAVAAESGQVDHAPKMNQISHITQNAKPRLIGSKASPLVGAIATPIHSWGAVPSEAYVRDGEWFFVSKSSGRERALPTPAPPTPEKGIME